MEKKSSVYELEGVPPLKEAIPLGMQHVLAMFAGNITPIMVIAGALSISVQDRTFLIQASMFIAGVVTLLQLYFGAKLPIVMGTSSGFIGTSLAIGAKYGLAGILGASLIGGVFEGVLGFFIKPLRKFFPPLVTGTVVLTIGLSLIPIGVRSFGGGSGAADFGSLSNLFLGTVVLVTILMLKQFTKGFSSASAILIGIIVGYLIAIPMGKVDFGTVQGAGWFSFPTPLKFGLAFHWDAIVAMGVMYIVTAVETVGDISGITMGGLKRDATDKELSSGVIMDGIGSSLAALFGVLPNTSFSQNVGIVALTGVVNRFAIATGAIFLIIAGLFPKVGALISIMPSSVLGGAAIIMFSMITISGINLVTQEPLDGRNGIILATALALGLGMSSVPEILVNMPEGIRLLFGGSGIVIAATVALVLNIVFPKTSTPEKAKESAV
ncbi:uracil-xanthine permease [Alkaliphilus metalliredigens QYMF]|uniref:Uracil-xanthine permease n=1 Tax=Alkaliphilus metalliredigens (strain QYMF) TaxID=293826 RepID=A6TKH5_ALKMQ|nr:nucleobase:cation symporter-2 family protein [Alkaliphilus metalliredigens]ABR46693.1 uracil-xanthine permease [Alkaliphilus metalliredigens QYMF]